MGPEATDIRHDEEVKAAYGSIGFSNDDENFLNEQVHVRTDCAG